MKKMKALAMMSVLTLSATQTYSYDVVDRFKLIDDKLQTERMMDPIGHDFFLDLGASLNKNAKDFVSDVKDAANYPSADATAKLNNAQRVLLKYDKTEQTVKIHGALGFPIFSFSAWNLKVQPNVRAFVDAGANIGIRTERLTIDMILQSVNVDLPQEVVTAIKSNVPGSFSGQDILDPDGSGTLCNSLTDPTNKALCIANKGKYFYPSNSSVPDMLLFAKLDAKVGLFNDYNYGEHFFGNWNLYGLNRTDIFQRVNADMIAKGSKVDFPKTKNTETTLQTDFRLGYKNDNYRVFTSLEEVKLSKMKERDAGSKELSYGYDPLMRLHADANYRWSILSVNPFLGFHKRKGYGFSDGMYAGSDFGAHVWGDRLGLQFRGMVDKQYFTISPRMKLWLMSLEYSLKAPMKSMDGDVKLSALHSIDLRLFF